MSVHRAEDFTMQDFLGLKTLIESLPEGDLREFFEHMYDLLKAGEDIVLYTHERKP